MLAKVFKAYDVRALYPKPLNEKLAWQIGHAAAQYLLEEAAAAGFVDPMSRTASPVSDLWIRMQARCRPMTVGQHAATLGRPPRHQSDCMTAAMLSIAKTSTPEQIVRWLRVRRL